ncbi:hypothetical protein ZIOFF_072319 [Zingiber officinale]|uniref:cinnamyl-alcohol dehydrogenase n=1 Tax=Zingiber officinale TaxID=94328 RepID=A0A8J5C2T4_ZINOF|nr:hypothetical protein ZIOFF_072319 [Zingiber officinale]
MLDRKNGENDVTIKILYCGICHSDLHSVKNGWQNSVYPIVPGIYRRCSHEIVGVVTEVGGKVGRFKLGDHAGVDCMVNSCRSWHECARHHENYCPGMIMTCNATDADGTVTYGGYSDSIVVEEHFAVKFPAGMPLDRSAPLLCAGITVYSPMKRFGLDVPGKHIEVVGLGGLGHVAVKFGKAFGAKVTVISTSPSKRQEAVERLGANAFLVSKDPDEMKGAWGTMDGIINTVSAAHDVTPWLFLLKTSGQMIMVGAPLKPLEIYAFPLLLGGKSIVGSIIGGMKETQEMIDFAGLVAE